LRKQACGFQEDCHGGDIVIGPKSARSRVIVRTENPVGFLQSAKVTRHGFEIVAIEAIYLECLPGNFQADTRKKFLDKVRRAREAGGIVAKIALLEGKGFGDLKEVALEIAGASRRQFIHLKKLSENWCEQHKKRVLF
jgi:hypothetical protein